jgi:hypothetical protein
MTLETINGNANYAGLEIKFGVQASACFSRKEPTSRLNSELLSSSLENKFGVQASACFSRKEPTSRLNSELHRSWRA